MVNSHSISPVCASSSGPQNSGPTQSKWAVPLYLELGAGVFAVFGGGLPSQTQRVGPRHVLIRIVVPGHGLNANVTSPRVADEACLPLSCPSSFQETQPSLAEMVSPTCTLNRTLSVLVLTNWPMSDNSWRMLLQADQASDEFPRLAMEILDAQRQNTLDVSQFAKDEVTQLIELIDTRVRDPRHLTCLM